MPFGVVWSTVFTIVFVHLCLCTWITQSPHGSPYHVHPYPSPLRLQHAFQPPQNNSPKMFYPKGLKPQHEQRVQASPQLSPIMGRALCLTAKDGAAAGRISHLSDRFNQSLTLHSDTDALVAKIGAMFPTVSDTHIKILLKKYHNREAVVISALQVEKHPLVTPGPLTASPSAARLSKSVTGVYSAFVMAKGSHEYSLTYSATPNGSPSLYRPPSGASSYYGAALRSSDGQPTRHHSPKMKLKYIKSIFPKADEMVILEILSNNDNNVQKVSEELAKRGFVKKDTSHKKQAPPAAAVPQPVAKPPPLPTTNDKLQMKMKYEKQYPMIAERIISIALESVDYNEGLTEQILGTVLVEDGQPRPPVCVPKEVKRVTILEPTGQISKSSTAEAKDWSNCTASLRGPDLRLRHGPQDALLQDEYLPWSGPDPGLRGGAVVRSEGPAPRTRPATQARGSASLAKGPQGLAKGSIYFKNYNKPAKIYNFKKLQSKRNTIP